jgi:5,5'-dehydrodivanillate O-demethylase oxygenase subunit
VLAQDAIAWQSQGALTDRSHEKLGRTDIPIVLLRRQLEQQIRVVEDGGEPMNVFRDPAQVGEMLHGGGQPPEDWLEALRAGKPLMAHAGSSRANFHKGFVLDDADRYGSAVPLIQELHRRIAAQVAAAPA